MQANVRTQEHQRGHQEKDDPEIPLRRYVRRQGPLFPPPDPQSLIGYRLFQFGKGSLPDGAQRRMNVTVQRPQKENLDEERGRLRRVVLFEGLTHNERTWLADEPIVRQGDPGSSLFVVKEGILDVTLKMTRARSARSARSAPDTSLAKCHC